MCAHLAVDVVTTETREHQIEHNDTGAIGFNTPQCTDVPTQ
jgi:hypothetical protein